MSAGTNSLIRDGAILATSLDDILEHLGPVGERMGMPPCDPHANGHTDPETGAPKLPPGLDPTETTLLTALTPGSMTLDELVRQTSLQSGQVAAAMTMLVLKGAVTQQPGNVFVRKR